MKYFKLLNSIFLLPISKAIKLVEDYQKNVGFKNFAEQQKVLDVLANKSNVQGQIKNEAFQKALMLLAFMCKNKSSWSRAAFEIIKDYPTVIWMECIGTMDAQSIMVLLNNYYKEFSSFLIEICIVNLPENMQLTAIEKYRDKLDATDKMFSIFSFAVCENARKKLREYFPNLVEDDILLELEDLEESAVFDKLSSEQERLMKLSADDLIEFILLKSSNHNTLNKFFELFSDKVKESSISKFELLFTRYKYLTKYHLGEKDQQFKILSDSDLFVLFKDKFHQLGIVQTLSLFDRKTQYDINKFTVNVILEFMDIAYSDIDIASYINDETEIEIINRFVEKCNSRDYSIEDLERLVKNIGKDGKAKLIHDDYIESIVACGKLIRARDINDKNSLFLELRNKFSADLLSRCEKDGTYLENISLNGIFYRLAKGTISFDKVYMVKTYKGLIYLSKCGQMINEVDYITDFLTDEQLVKLNIKPLIRWRNEINKNNENIDDISFVERMGLQLLCYFGKDKGKYLLNSDMQENRMENLFDGLKYQSISIAENGTPNINEELINYLFGNGMMKEPNSVINKMIRGEICEFEKYFTEFCNSFIETKKACEGILTIKRIVKHFENIDLPITLKPDEIEFTHALKEMNTIDSGLLSEAIELCKDARNREYSSIPKVEGKMGDFTYEILNLKNSLAVAVGYLSHCCFVVRGISYSSLKHSMQSKNGRTFVVYYKGQFLTQSWVWRNGDIICFDSVEAGCPYHGMYEDNIRLVDVYKTAAQEMLYISSQTEDDMQKVKAVTVGKTDYTFEDLEEVGIDVPRPLEENVYVRDSNSQKILAGEMPKEPRYGVVAAQYSDPRKKIVIIDNEKNYDIDTLDDVALNVNSLRYQINKEEMPIEFSEYTKIISGDGWYILINHNGSIESGSLNGNRKTIEEYNQYLSKYSDIKRNSKSYVKSLVPLNTNYDRG